MKKKCLLFPLFIFTLLPVNTIAAQDPLTVKNDYVGVATDDPKTTFHIYGAADKDVYAGMGVNPLVGTSSAFNMGYSGHSFGEGSGFFNVRDAPGAVAPNPSLRFMTANVQRVIIDDQGYLGLYGGTGGLGGSFDPTHPIQARSGAHLTSGGIWTNSSSRELKQNIRPLELSAARQALLALAPSQFSYKATPDDPHVGFIAEDVPDLVATPDRKTLASMDIVAVLTRVVQAQEERIQRLEELLAKSSLSNQHSEAQQ